MFPFSRGRRLLLQAAAIGTAAYLLSSCDTAKQDQKRILEYATTLPKSSGDVQWTGNVTFVENQKRAITGIHVDIEPSGRPKFEMRDIQMMTLDASGNPATYELLQIGLKKEHNHLFVLDWVRNTLFDQHPEMFYQCGIEEILRLVDGLAFLMLSPEEQQIIDNGGTRYYGQREHLYKPDGQPYFRDPTNNSVSVIEAGERYTWSPEDGLTAKALIATHILSAKAQQINEGGIQCIAQIWLNKQMSTGYSTWDVAANFPEIGAIQQICDSQTGIQTQIGGISGEPASYPFSW
ncbi:hypothetical protein JW887_02115 [Candidatus Dojkabacteria bacterium]|nr:hypothetical protein [Candidatus Dojkabacteria bacterium]